MRSTTLLDYPKYTVYDDGTLESTSTKKSKVKPSITPDGYYQVNVMSPLSKNGYRHSIKVHRLIALAFCENPNNYKEVNHIDGNKLNNHYSNLEWISRSGNLKHCYKLGLRNSEGSRKASSKLKEWQVKAIRWLYDYTKLTQEELGLFYNVTQTQIGSIIHRKSWKHI